MSFLRRRDRSATTIAYESWGPDADAVSGHTASEPSADAVPGKPESSRSRNNEGHLEAAMATLAKHSERED